MIDGFASLTLIFLVFFFVEKKRFCGTMFLLCGTLFWGLGRFFLPWSRMDINRLFAELMLLSNCCNALSLSQPSTSVTMESNLTVRAFFFSSLSDVPSLFAVCLKHSLRKFNSEDFSKCLLSPLDH